MESELPTLGILPLTLLRSVARQVSELGHMNDMPSFFLSETLKYLYLIFDDDNWAHGLEPQ